MSEPIITVDHLTKDYGNGRGVFDVSFSVEPGEVFGYLGTNGSGKTTTIRQMMGFIKPQGGNVTVNGLVPWKMAPQLMQYVSYIPGEIEFPPLPTGNDFFSVQARYLEVSDKTRMNRLIEAMELDPSANLKRMSKGMKQKTAVVAALMAERDILILDEPTTGLDPLMRENFLDLIREEKAAGHTVFMSSHIFEEIEDICDHVGIVHNGHLLEVLDLSKFRNSSVRKLTLTFADPADAAAFAEKWDNALQDHAVVRAQALPEEMGRLFLALRHVPVRAVHEEHMNLEEYFMQIIGANEKPNVKEKVS